MRSVFLSRVCLSASVISGTAGPIFTKFFVHIPCGHGSASSGGSALCYVLPVSWMTSRLATVGIMTMCGRLNL